MQSEHVFFWGHMFWQAYHAFVSAKLNTASNPAVTVIGEVVSLHPGWPLQSGTESVVNLVLSTISR